MIDHKENTLGLICGRFSHIHKGHQLIINKSIETCENTLILVGSSQESNTLRNPFTSDFRIELIKKIYDTPKVKIEKLPDLTNEYDITYEWGQYVINKTIEIEGKMADAIITGNDETRKGWFSKEQTKNIKEIIVDRTNINISATKLRGYILINDKQNWKKYISEKIEDEFEKIRNELLKVEIYKKILNEMGEEKTIQKYTKIYKEYEIQNKKILEKCRKNH